MAIHFCPNCRNDWNCYTPNCDGSFKDKWCNPCRDRLARYWKPQDL